MTNGHDIENDKISMKPGSLPWPSHVLQLVTWNLLGFANIAERASVLEVGNSLGHTND